MTCIAFRLPPNLGPQSAQLHSVMAMAACHSSLRTSGPFGPEDRLYTSLQTIDVPSYLTCSFLGPVDPSDQRTFGAVDPSDQSTFGPVDHSDQRTRGPFGPEELSLQLLIDCNSPPGFLLLFLSINLRC